MLHLARMWPSQDFLSQADALPLGSALNSWQHMTPDGQSDIESVSRIVVVPTIHLYPSTHEMFQFDASSIRSQT